MSDDHDILSDEQEADNGISPKTTLQTMQTFRPMIKKVTTKFHLNKSEKMT